MAIQLEARCDLADAHAAADARPRPILQFRDPPPSHPQGQDGGISNLELPRVLHVPFYQVYVLGILSFVPMSQINHSFNQRAREWRSACRQM